MHRKQPADLDLLGHLAELDLHAFAIGKLHAKTLAMSNVLLRDFHAALGEAEPSHAVRQPRRTEPDLRDLEAITFTQQHVLARNFQSIEFELAVTAMLVRAHDRDAANDAPARLILVVEERRQTTPLVVRCARDQDEVSSALGTGEQTIFGRVMT